MPRSMPGEAHSMRAPAGLEPASRGRFRPGHASDIQAGQHCSGYDGFYSFLESFHSP